MEIKPLKDIPSLEAFSKYGVTRCGRVYSFYSNKFLVTGHRTGKGPNPYEVITLTDDNGVRRKFSVHRLVAMAFDYNPLHEELTVNHKDEDTLNNDISNLEWMTAADNIRYSQKGKHRCGDADAIANEWNTCGMTITEFADKHSMSVTAIWELVEKSNVGNKRKRKLVSDEEKSKIYEYSKTHEIRETATHFGCSESLVNQIRAKHKRTGINDPS